MCEVRKKLFLPENEVIYLHSTFFFSCKVCGKLFRNNTITDIVPNGSNGEFYTEVT